MSSVIDHDMFDYNVACGVITSVSKDGSAIIKIDRSWTTWHCPAEVFKKNYDIGTRVVVVKNKDGGVVSIRREDRNEKTN